MILKDELDAHFRAFEGLDLAQVQKAGGMICNVFNQGGKVLLCGNGGSAADAQHFAAELVGRFTKERRALPAIALTTDTSALTAIGNDFGFDDIFARQIKALGLEGDILIAISTSGNSQNIIEAIHTARKQNMAILTLTGGKGGKAAELGDLNINVKSNQTARIQEIHIFIIHCLCGIMDEVFVG